MTTVIKDPPPPELEEPKRPSFNWPLLGYRVVYWLWTLVTKATIFIVCQDLMSTGVIHIFPDMGKKLWKIPFFSFLNDYEATHRLTLANVFVCIPILSTFMLWGLIFKLYLASERFEKTYNRFDAARTKKVILIIGVIVILADAGLFFASFGMSGWGGAKYGPSTFLATGLYIAIIAFSSLISVYLSDAIIVLKQKDKENSHAS